MIHTTRNDWRTCWLHLFFVVLVCGQTALAAGPPPSPGAVKGTLPERDQLQPPKEAPPPEIKTPEPTPAAPPSSAKTIRVEQFLFTGNTAIETADLIAEIQPFIGQDLTLDDLYTVADVLTDYYRARGYNLAKVVVPAQRVEGGIVRLDVIEGKINAVLFEDNKSYTKEFLQPFFYRIQPGAVVSMRSLERELLLLNDLPGFVSRAVVQPGPTFGTTDLVIRGKEDRFQGHLATNNYGRQDIGEWRLEGDVTINNPLRHGDRFTLFGIHSESNLLNYVSGDYSIALNGKGTRAALTVAYFDYKVGHQFASLDIDGNNLYSHLLISHPLQRSRKRNILLGVGVGNNLSKERTLSVTTQDDSLVFLDVNLLVNWLHRHSAYSTARATVSTNFQDNSDGTDNEALEAKLELELDHLRTLAPNWFVYFRGFGVYAWDPLPDTEKLDLGGITRVRGFPPSEVRGDKGGMLTVELRRQFRLKNRISANVKAFWDVGEATRMDAPPGVDSYQNLSSIGLGFTVSYADKYVLEAAIAKPTDNRDVSDGRDDGRGWLNISAYF